MREVFERAITVRYIASSLASFDFERTSVKIRALLQRKDYDLVGVRREGLVIGYARTEDLKYGQLGDHLREFSEDEVVTADLPMLEALEAVRDRHRIFVQVMGEVHGIVTPADGAKPPVRLWLFGLITVLEMQLNRLVRACYPGEACLDALAPGQAQKARALWKKKQQNQTDVDLVDCLFLPDKLTLVIKAPQLMAALNFTSEHAETFLKRVTDLRNKLAHADDISVEWPHFLHDAADLEDFIQRAEGITSRQLGVQRSALL
jgi:hypothetical protein